MFSMQLFQVMVDERERTIREEVRVRRLLRPAKSQPESSRGPESAQAEPWRARTPRASATTR